MSLDLVFRHADKTDIPALAALLADDALGAQRDGVQFIPAYTAAFEAMQAQGGNFIIVAELDGGIAGMLQLTFIPGFARGGALRAQIEGVRVSSALRGRKIGHALFQHAIGLARDAGCSLIQLTSDKQRTDAIRFYETLGFQASHQGMKLWL